MWAGFQSLSLSVSQTPKPVLPCQMGVPEDRQCLAAIQLAQMWLETVPAVKAFSALDGCVIAHALVRQDTAGPSAERRGTVDAVVI